MAQWPNLSLWLFIGLSAAGGFLDAWGPAARGLRLAASAALAWWAADEVIRGVNPWRRCLGAAVLLGEVATLALASGAPALN